MPKPEELRRRMQRPEPPELVEDVQALPGQDRGPFSLREAAERTIGGIVMALDKVDEVTVPMPAADDENGRALMGVVCRHLRAARFRVVPGESGISVRKPLSPEEAAAALAVKIQVTAKPPAPLNPVALNPVASAPAARPAETRWERFWKRF